MTSLLDSLVLLGLLDLSASSAGSGQGRYMSEPRDAAAPAKATLITFPPSLDCELSRFLLIHYGVPFEEERHTVIFSFAHTLWHGSTIYFPLLYGGGYPPLNHVRLMID